MNSLEAKLFAEVRKTSGALGRVALAECRGIISLDDMIRVARTTWERLDHEDNDQQVRVESEIEDLLDLNTS